jgi:hypothetical protein
MQSREVLFLFIILFVLGPPAWGDYVKYEVFDIFGPNYCEGSDTASTIATITMPTSCTSLIPIILTGSGTGWTASATEVGGEFNYNLNGNVWASAAFTPTAVILGGHGTGFFKVEYTDTLLLSSPGGASQESQASMSAGDLSLSLNCGQSDNYCFNTALSDTVWSGWIPFTFDETVDLPAMSAEFYTTFSEGSGGDPAATESVTAFDIVDQNMNPLPWAYAVPTTPEPSSFTLTLGIALTVLVVVRKRQRCV